MAQTHVRETRASLLERLRDPTDREAWEDFVKRYVPRIFRWCRSRGLQQAEAEDVTQEVLFKLAARMKTFVYDPERSFRAWLMTVTHHAWFDFKNDRQRAGLGQGGDEGQELLTSIPAGDDLVKQLEEEFKLELLEKAMARVQLRVEPHTWRAFKGMVIDGRSAADVAAEEGMTVNAVFKAVSRVRQLVREEFKRLDPSKDD
jgi:RNA polymerase sigma-70 factor (ECF subfamily)